MSGNYKTTRCAECGRVVSVVPWPCTIEVNSAAWHKFCPGQWVSCDGVPAVAA